MLFDSAVSSTQAMEAQRARMITHRRMHRLSKLLPTEWAGGSITWRYHHRYYSMGDHPCWHSGVLRGHLWIRVQYAGDQYVVTLGRGLLTQLHYACVEGRAEYYPAALLTDPGAIPTDAHLCDLLATLAANLHMYVDRMHCSVGSGFLYPNQVLPLDDLV